LAPCPIEAEIVLVNQREEVPGHEQRRGVQPWTEAASLACHTGQFATTKRVGAAPVEMDPRPMDVLTDLLDERGELPPFPRSKTLVESNSPRTGRGRQSCVTGSQQE
jgi:hypothetical protein